MSGTLTNHNACSEHNENCVIDNCLSTPFFQRATIKTGSYENVTVVAADSSGNRATCHFQIAIQPTPCSSWELVAPIHGSLDCQETESEPVGHNCVAKCDVGYRLVVSLWPIFVVVFDKS